MSPPFLLPLDAHRRVK